MIAFSSVFFKIRFFNMTNDLKKEDSSIGRVPAYLRKLSIFQRKRALLVGTIGKSSFPLVPTSKRRAKRQLLYAFDKRYLCKIWAERIYLRNMPCVIHSVRLRLSAAVSPFPPFHSSFFFPQSFPNSFSFSRITFVSLVTFIFSLLRCFSLFISTLPPALPPFLHCVHVALPFSLFFLSGSFAAISPHSFFSHSLPLSLAKSLFVSFTRSFHWSSLLLCSRRSHLPAFSFALSFTLSWRVLCFSLPLFRVQRSLVFLFFHTFTTAVELFSLLYPLLFLILISSSFLPRAPFNPRRPIFPFFFFLRPTIFFFRMDRRFIPSVLGRFKISKVLNASKRERFE